MPEASGEEQRYHWPFHMKGSKGQMREGVLSWPESLFSFFCKIKDIFKISPITLLIWIF